MTHAQTLSTFFLAALYAASASAQGTVTKGVIERCDGALVAAEQAVQALASCRDAVLFEADEELDAATLDRLRAYAAAARYAGPAADICGKLATPEALEQCRAFVAGLRGGSGCQKVQPGYSALCREASVYAQASRAGDANVCAGARRCYMLMGAPVPPRPAPPAPAVSAAGNRGVVCKEPLHSAENRKAVGSALATAQTCLADVDTLLPLPDASVAKEIDDRVERLARLRLRHDEIFERYAASAPAAAPAKAAPRAP